MQSFLDCSFIFGLPHYLLALLSFRHSYLSNNMYRNIACDRFNIDVGPTDRNQNVGTFSVQFINTLPTYFLKTAA